MTKTKAIGLAAAAVAGLGYGGLVTAVLLAKFDVIAPATAVFAGIGLGLVGEAGLWVAAACLGWTLFKGRKALIDRLMRRRAEPV